MSNKDNKVETANFQETLKICRQVTQESICHEKWILKLMGRVLKVVAPLMWRKESLVHQAELPTKRQRPGVPYL